MSCADTTGEELIALLDALTTNFTSFLREARSFRLLAQDHRAEAQRPNSYLERGVLDRRRAVHHRILAARRAWNSGREPDSHSGFRHFVPRAGRRRAGRVLCRTVQGFAERLEEQISACAVPTARKDGFESSRLSAGSSNSSASIWWKRSLRRSRFRRSFAAM